MRYRKKYQGKRKGSWRKGRVKKHYMVPRGGIRL